jgi:hypothetical protein
LIPRTITRLALAALILTGIVSACSDTDTVTGPRPFHVVLEVTDPDGRSVPGLELGMAPDTPWYVDGTSRRDSAFAPAEQLLQPYPNPSNGFRIPFSLDATSRVALTVEDIEGVTVRALVDGQMEAGARTAFWDGHGDSGALMPSGVYTAHLVVRDLDTETVLLDDSRRMLLAVFDQMKLGPTDPKGRIVLEDKKLFPFLYDVPDMPAVDANGAVVGAIKLGPTVRFYFTDPSTGTIRRYDRDVAGSATLSFVWNPPPVAK